MHCSKCGTIIPQNCDYCLYCREPVNNSHQNQHNYSMKYSKITNDKSNKSHEEHYNYAYNYSNMNMPKISSDEDYIKIFVGPNYNSFKTVKFSIPFFLLGPIYLLYRKLWKYSILLLIIEPALSYFTKDFALPITVFIWFIISSKFNHLYLKYAEKKVNEIKERNMDKSSQELLNICKSKGGVSIGSTIILVIILISIITTLNVYTAFKDNAKIYDYMYDETETDTDTDTRTDTNLNTKIGDLYYEIPDNFKESYTSYNYQTYYYYDINNDCDITLEKNNYTSMYPTKEKYLESLINAKHNVVGGIKKETYNGIEWVFATEYTNIDRTIYTTMKNNTLYRVEIVKRKDSTGICSKGHQELIDSLSFNSTTV